MSITKIELFGLLETMYPKCTITPIGDGWLIGGHRTINLKFDISGNRVLVTLHSIYNIDGVDVDLFPFFPIQGHARSFKTFFYPREDWYGIKSRLDSKISSNYLEYAVKKAIADYHISLINGAQTNLVKSELASICGSTFVGDKLKTVYGIEKIHLTVVLDFNKTFTVSLSNITPGKLKSIISQLDN